MKPDTSDDLKPTQRSVRRQRRLRRLRRVPKSVVQFLDFLGTVLFASIWRFVRRWSASRPLGPLARGLPAALAAIFVVLVAVAVRERVSDGNTVGRYRQSAANALQREDLPAAGLWVEKVTQQGAASPAYEYRLGILAAGQGDRIRAREIMQRLAPRQRAGYADAHFWLALDLIRQSRRLTRESAQIVEYHLLQALRSERLCDKAQATLGQLYLAEQDWDHAVEYFRKAARRMPELNMTLSNLYRSLKDEGRAREAAQRGVEHFRGLAQSEPDHWQYRVQWARCELLAGDHSAAIKILSPLLDDPDAGPSVRETLAMAYLGAFDQIVVKTPQDNRRKLELLNQALQFGPMNPGVLRQLTDMVTRESEMQDSGDVTRMDGALQRALADGVATAVVHLVLGIRQLESDAIDRAVMHLELAQKSNSAIPAVLNGLAWGLAHRDNPDLPRALSLIDLSLRLADDPRSRGTRAVVLDLLDRPADAVAELESALAEHPDPAWAHRKLADLHRRTGNTVQADEQEGQARAIEQKRGP